jgi:hypothetical protein
MFVHGSSSGFDITIDERIYNNVINVIKSLKCRYINLYTTQKCIHLTIDKYLTYISVKNVGILFSYWGSNTVTVL